MIQSHHGVHCSYGWLGDYYTDTLNNKNMFEVVTYKLSTVYTLYTYDWYSYREITNCDTRVVNIGIKNACLCTQKNLQNTKLIFIRK